MQKQFKTVHSPRSTSQTCRTETELVRILSVLAFLNGRADIGAAKPFLPVRLGSWNLLGINERFRYYRYDVGQTFRQHYDGSFCRHPGEESKLTFMVYLNDHFTGGTTEFYDGDGSSRETVQPKRGMALVFRHAQLHEGAPVAQGRKYVLRTDVMYQREG